MSVNQTATNSGDQLETGTLARRPRMQIYSYAILCLFAFACLDLANRYLFQPNIYGSANKSWIWWAVKNYREKTPPPDTILMGSSLIIAVENDGDATYYHKNLDAVKHYHSEYLEDKAKNYLHKKIKTASFAIGGQIASDAYAIFVSMLSNQSAPKTVIWGVAPRDFVDRTYPHPEDTETVRYLSQISNDPELVKAEHRTFWQQLEKTLTEISSIYARRGQYVEYQKEASAEMFQAAIPDSSKFSSPAWLLNEVNVAFGEDNVEGEWICRPFGEKKQTHADNSTEYKQRYNPFHEELYRNQLQYGEKLLKLAKRQHTKIILINMPLRKSNLALLPAGIYERYLQDITRAARDNDALFIDMNSPALFTPADFWDPVHLNGVGSIKWVNYLCEIFHQHNLP